MKSISRSCVKASRSGINGEKTIRNFARNSTRRTSTGRTSARRISAGRSFTGRTSAWADLSLANLSKANLYWADLHGANLRGANLNNVDLNESSLTQANLYRADLSGADLIAAVVGSTTFADVKLGEITGLKTVQHNGPSTVGTDTLRLSEGKLPDEFLKGCGLADWEIEAARLYDPHLSASDRGDIIYKIDALLRDNPIQFYSCFISYSHADKDFARRLHDELQNRGIRCWLDEKQLLPGDEIHEEVDRAIRLRDKVLLCCSETSLSSWWVDREIKAAIAKERRSHAKDGKKKLALIPLNLDGYMFEWDGSHAITLQDRLVADFTDWEQDDAKFEEQFERVVLALTDS